LLAAIQKCEAEEVPKDQVSIQEKKHGRDTEWTTKIFEVNHKDLQSNWSNLSTFIVINKTVIQKDKAKNLITTNSVSYRISDVKHLSVEAFFNGIRGHWGIENRTHWVKSDRRCGCHFE
jgi:predicted transposase YbfD/YdcC